MDRKHSEVTGKGVPASAARHPHGVIALVMDVAMMSGEDFLKACRAFVGLINEVSKSVDEQFPSDGWQVSVREGSQVLYVHADPAKIGPHLRDRVESVIFEGLNALDKRPEAPFCNEQSVHYMETLCEMSTREKGNMPIRIESKSQSAGLTKSMRDNARQALNLHYEYEDEGTVDGTLNVLSARSGYEFRVSDSLTGKAIKCVVNEPLLEQAYGLFRKRVEVAGLIGYDKHGFPKQVKASSIEPFPEPETIPHYSTLKGILRED